MTNPRRPVWLGVLVGILGGLFGGLVGVGGGPFLVPMLSGWMGLDQHRAQATSLSIVFLVALVGSVVYASEGSIDGGLAAPVALASVVTVLLSARWVRGVPAWRLRRAFGGLMVLVALRLIVMGWTG